MMTGGTTILRLLPIQTSAYYVEHWYHNKWQGEIFSPTDVAVDANSNLFTADFSHHLMQKFQLMF